MDPTGDKPPDLHIGLRSRARHNSPPAELSGSVPALEDPSRKGPERGPFSSHIARDGDWGPFFRSSRGPKIRSYATGVDFVFMFQEDTFYPPPHRFKFQAKTSSTHFYSFLVKVKLKNWWPWSGLSGSLKVKLIALSDSRSISYYKCSSVSIALSRTESLFFQQMILIWPFKVTKGQTDHAIRFAIYHFLYVFYSNYSAISHGIPVFQQTTLIWLFKVTRGQTDLTICFATHHFP